MMMSDLKKILKLVGLPVTYSHWEEPNVPDPPYICYLMVGSANLLADNKVYHKINDVSIELYTTKKDLAMGEELEKVLDDYEIPYNSDEIYISSEQLFLKTYEVRLI